MNRLQVFFCTWISYWLPSMAVLAGFGAYNLQSHGQPGHVHSLCMVRSPRVHIGVETHSTVVSPNIKLLPQGPKISLESCQLGRSLQSQLQSGYAGGPSNQEGSLWRPGDHVLLMVVIGGSSPGRGERRDSWCTAMYWLLDVIRGM